MLRYYSSDTKNITYESVRYKNVVQGEKQSLHVELHLGILIRYCN
jgi:hypothetical protein